MKKSMNTNWNMSGLILEGVSGTGKSTILRALHRSKLFVQKPFLSSIVLSEHQTQRVLERKEREEGLTRSDNLALLDHHVSYLESMRDRLDQMQWCNSNETNMRVPYILERFHFTHVYHYNHMSWADVRGIDLRLAKLSCKTCLFVVDDSIFEDRIITGRDSGWLNYLSRYGKTNDEIVQHYIEQQKQLLNLCEKSEMETLIINTTKLSVDETLSRALDFWGALSAPTA